MTSPTDALAALGDLSVAFAPPDATAWSDSELLTAQKRAAEIRRRSDAFSAAVAAEIAHRSRPDLGYDGLAQKLGARTPEKLVQRLTEGSAGDARSLVRVGRLLSTMDAGAAPDPARTQGLDDAPWLSAAAVAVAAGRLSIARADAIRTGLGGLEPGDPPGLRDALAAAVATLLRESPGLSLERLAARARRLRAELDADAVARNEQRLRSRRYLHLIPQLDGMTRLTGLLDPESAALVTSALDAATSPRGNGPRFVDPREKKRAEELARDERTTEQIALDAFVELVRIGGEVDGSRVLGTRKPAVRILVTGRDLAAGAGFGVIEGQTEPISIASVKRSICEAGGVPIVFDDDGQALNLGRTARLHNAAQRLVIAARDGGCIFPFCDRPPAWTEVHHPEEWERDRGETSVANGVLLCKHHHMLVHNTGWQVIRDGGGYAVVPPASIDPTRTPIPAPSKSEALRRLLASGAS